MMEPQATLLARWLEPHSRTFQEWTYPIFLYAPLLVSVAPALQQEEGSRKHAKHLSFGGQATRAPILALPLTSSVTLSKLYNLSGLLWAF